MSYYCGCKVLKGMEYSVFAILLLPFHYGGWILFPLFLAVEFYGVNKGVLLLCLMQSL